MQQFFQSISAFFQKATSDGIPFWIVFIRDAVAPIFTIAGGIFVFLIWNRRMLKEHKMSRQTAAYELLLAKEMEYYNEILDTTNEAGTYAFNTAADISGIDHKTKKSISNHCVDDIRHQGTKLHSLYKKTNIFINSKIAEEIQEMMLKMGRALVCLTYLLKASDEVEIDRLQQKLDEAILLLTEIDDIADRISGHIKLHLQEISRNK